MTNQLIMIDQQIKKRKNKKETRQAHIKMKHLNAMDKTNKLWSMRFYFEK